jgi:uncharacterized membrane-anchored protein
MRDDSVPVLGTRYWTALCAASVFGANLGDFASHVLHLGHWRGLLPLSLVLAALLVGERRSGRGGEAWYWAAILVLRAAATNLADLATHDAHMAYSWAIALLEALLVLLVLPVGGRGAATGRPSTGGWYWAAMLTAGTLGTAIGDCVADDFGLGTAIGTLVLGAVLAAVLAAGAAGGWRNKAAYWIAVVAVRSAGTTAGDFLVGHGAGLALATATSGGAFIGMLILWRPKTALFARPAHPPPARRRLPIAPRG